MQKMTLAPKLQNKTAAPQDPQKPCLEHNAALCVAAPQLHILVLGQVAVQLAHGGELALTVLAGMAHHSPAPPGLTRPIHQSHEMLIFSS